MINVLYAYHWWKEDIYYKNSNAIVIIILKFKYLEHKAHRKCVMQYYKNDIPIHSKYACPLKCPLMWLYQ